jgi:hypothetical protein
MRSIWNSNRSSSSGAHARWRWRLTAGLVTPLAAMGLATAFATAAYAAPPPPARGVTPGAATEEGGGPLSLFYTATDGTVWTGAAAGTPGPLTKVGNGVLVGGPSAITAGTVQEFAFGRGTNNALWWANQFKDGGWSNWTSLGGNLTSKPGAVFRGSSDQNYSVFARGTNGAAWELDHTTAGWGAWHSIGGNLLAGTGPAAAISNGATFVLVVGTNKQLYLQQLGAGGFSPAGGQTTADPGLASIAGALVGFARGTDNLGYYHRFLSTSPGWHSMAGKFTSGFTAVGVGSTTYTFGLGTDSQVYRNIGTWTGYPPTFSGWTKVTG